MSLPSIVRSEELVEIGLGDDIRCPDFTRTSKCHDWRNHVPHSLRDIWHALSAEAKGAVFVCADDAASMEEWD